MAEVIHNRYDFVVLFDVTRMAIPMEIRMRGICRA